MRTIVYRVTGSDKKTPRRIGLEGRTVKSRIDCELLALLN
jgi:hypothetical protein